MDEKEARETVLIGPSLDELMEKSIRLKDEFNKAKGYLEGLEDERQKAKGLVKLVETMDNEFGGVIFISGTGHTTIRESLKIPEVLAEYKRGEMSDNHDSFCECKKNGGI